MRDRVPAMGAFDHTKGTGFVPAHDGGYWDAFGDKNYEARGQGW